MIAEPTRITVPESVLDDLQMRLERTRWLPDAEANDWSAGTSPAYVRELVSYWQSDFNWREQEASLNEFRQFRATVNEVDIHFIHERSNAADAIPIVLTHGFPDSILRFRKLIPMLTNPTDHGGAPTDAFDVIVPSLPGFGFSGEPGEHGQLFHIGKLWHQLLTETLKYERYAAHGGDWGSLITEQIARDHRDSVIGIHLTDVPFWHLFQPPKDATAAESKFLKDNETTQRREGAYALLQGTRPQTLADGLADSPAGMAAWLVEKFQCWSDCDGNIESRFTKDELLTNLMFYWASNAIGTSFLPYYGITNASVVQWIKEKAKEWVGASHVPAAFAIFVHDYPSPPRSWAERFFNVERWTEMPRGGHFAAMEEPELLAQDIREFFRPFRVMRNSS